MASIPQAAGKFLYDAGISDPMATAYGEKLTNQAKAQLLQLQAQKEAQEYQKLKLQNDLDSATWANPEQINALKSASTNYAYENPLFDKTKTEDYFNKNNFQNIFKNPESPLGIKPFNPKGEGDTIGYGDTGNPDNGVLGTTPDQLKNKFSKLVGYSPKPWVSSSDFFTPQQKEALQNKTDNTTTTQPETTTQTTSNPYEYKDVSSFLGDGQDADFSGLTDKTAKAGSLLLDNLTSNGISAHINSAYRDAQRNANAGGVDGSNHMSGTALDIGYDNASDRDAIIAQAKASGWRVWPEGDHIHIDGFSGSLPDDQQTTTTTQTPAQTQQPLVAGQPFTSNYNPSMLSNGAFSNLFDKSKPNLGNNNPSYTQGNLFHKALPTNELSRLFPQQFAHQNKKSELEWLGLTPEEQRIGARIGSGLQLNAKETSDAQLAKQKQLDTVAHNLLDSSLKALDLQKKEGYTPQEADAINQVMSNLSIEAGLPGNTFYVKANSQNGRLEIATAADINYKQGSLANQTARTQLEAQKVAIEAANHNLKAAEFEFKKSHPDGIMKEHEVVSTIEHIRNQIQKVADDPNISGDAKMEFYKNMENTYGKIATDNNFAGKFSEMINSGVQLAYVKDPVTKP